MQKFQEFTFLNVFLQGTIATGITQPVDVMKTRLMEAKPGQYKVMNLNYS